MSVHKNVSELADRLTELLESTTTADARRLDDGSYEVTINVSAVTTSSTPRVLIQDIQLLKDVRDIVHLLIINIPVKGSEYPLSQLQLIVETVTAQTKHLVIDKMQEYDPATSQSAIRRLGSLTKELSGIVSTLAEHPDIGSIRVDLEVAERYIKKAKQDIETALIVQTRKATEAYQPSRLTLDDIVSVTGA